MMNYLIADILIRIKNAYLARHKEVRVPYSKMGFSLVEILTKRGFVENFEAIKDKGEIAIKLKFLKRKPAMTDLKIVSKPGLRVYVSKKEIPRVLGGLGTVIISTPRGLLTGEEARRKDLGGELICEVW